MDSEEQNIDPGNEAKAWAKIVSAILASIDSILGKLEAIFPWLRNWLDRPVVLPHTQRNWWHMGRTGDRKPSMQIVTYWYVTNRTDRPISVLNAYIKRPRWQGIVMTKDTRSTYHGSYPVPPQQTTELSAHFDVTPPFRKAGKTIWIDIVFVDQNGQRRTARNVEIRSQDQKRAPPAKLEEEAVYKLEHDVERNVAAVLKDEISRYRKFGRRSGQLGSLHAVYKGRPIKQIYQDGWTDSRSGERQEIVSDPQNVVVQSENGDALVKFFTGLEQDTDRELFVNSLLTRLNRDKEYYCVSYLILFVLFRIGRLADALTTARVTLPLRATVLDKLMRRKPRERLLEPHQRHGFGDLMGVLNGLLRYDHASFAEEELDLVEEFIGSVDEFSLAIGEKLNSVRAYRLNRSGP